MISVFLYFQNFIILQDTINVIWNSEKYVIYKRYTYFFKKYYFKSPKLLQYITMKRIFFSET